MYSAALSQAPDASEHLNKLTATVSAAHNCPQTHHDLNTHTHSANLASAQLSKYKSRLVFASANALHQRTNESTTGQHP